MHEYSIVSALVDRVQREVDTRPGAVVRRLHLKIGELAGVELDLLRTAYDTFRERTACAAAELEIEAVAAQWTCPRCAQPIARGAMLRCAACDRPARLTSGGDIILERIEMELADV
jgi:hydrogenase nickel incorporation protein HypA/HybF